MVDIAKEPGAGGPGAGGPGAGGKAAGGPGANGTTTDGAAPVPGASYAISALFADVIRILGRAWLPMALTALAPVLMLTAAGFVFAWQTGSDDPFAGGDIPLSAILLFCVGMLGLMHSYGAMCVIAGNAYADRPADLGGAVLAALRRLPALTLVALAVFTIVVLPVALLFTMLYAIGPAVGGIGALLSIPFMVWAAVSLAPALPAVMAEGRFMSSIPRAWSLSEGRRWSLAGSAFVAILVIEIVANIVGIGSLVGERLMTPGTTAVAVILISGTLGELIGWIGYGAVASALYWGLRALREGVADREAAEIFA
ncbi:MAG: hypothetical protein AAF677_02510 [Pseudomonadota bacterium]